MVDIKDLDNNPHTVEFCTVNDLNSHHNTCADLLELNGKSRREFKNYMFKAIKEKTAFKSKNCFIYYCKVEGSVAAGITMYGNNHPKEFLALSLTVFNTMDTISKKILISPHNPNLVEQCKSLLTKESINNYKTDKNSFLEINTEKLVNRITYWYKKRKIECVIPSQH